MVREGETEVTEMPRTFSPSGNCANVSVQIQIWENEQIKWVRFAWASLWLHSWHIISFDQVANVAGVLAEMCCCPTLFWALSPHHFLIIRILTAVLFQNKYVLSEPMSSGCLCLRGGTLLLTCTDTHAICGLGFSLGLILHNKTQNTQC